MIKKLNTGCVMPDGVYSNAEMSDDEYHALPRASNSIFKIASNNTMGAWSSSWMNPRRTNSDTEAKKTGRAYHKYILEGKAAFEQTHARTLNKDDYKDLLVTVADMTDWLSKMKLAVPTGKAKKDDLIKQIQRHPNAPPIFDVLIRKHKEQNANKTLLKNNVYDDISIANAIIRNSETLNASVSNGEPEVTFLYTLLLPEIDGSDVIYSLPCKARLDYLKLKSIVDLKTFSNFSFQPTKKVVTRAIANYSYHVQSASYLQAWSYALKLIASKQTFGSNQFKRFVEKTANQPKSFWFLFQQTGAPVNYLCEMETSQSLTYENARYKLKEGQINFCRNFDHFGAEPWVENAPVEILQDGDFPQYIYD